MICCGGVGVTVTGDKVGQLLNAAPASSIIGVSQLLVLQAELWLDSAGSILNAAHPQPTRQVRPIIIKKIVPHYEIKKLEIQTIAIAIKLLGFWLKEGQYIVPNSIVDK